MMNSNEVLILFSLYIAVLLEKSQEKSKTSFRRLKNEQHQSSSSIRFVTGDNYPFLS